MNIIHDKIGSEFLRATGSMDSSFGPGMIMFSHLPPVASFTRLAAHTVVQEFAPQEVILKKERASPDCSAATQGGTLACAGAGDYITPMGIKQEKLSEHDCHLPLYPAGPGKNTELFHVTVNQSVLVQDLCMGNLPSHLGKEPSGRKGRRSSVDGQEGKPRRKRNEAKLVLDADGCVVLPGSKPHVCDHCAAAFRSSYHLRRHVLIHTGERPYRCSQCNMSFIQKYLLQRHEKIHSGEKPFSCDQCNMRFIQKYHMERHKRTHSGEKPYRCDTCQQYFSRTDRLLKHKRTCGESIKKEDPGTVDLGFVDTGHGSYEVTQGKAGHTVKKTRKSRNPGEVSGGKKKKRSEGGTVDGGLRDAGVHGAVSGGYSIHEYSLSSSTESRLGMQQVLMSFKKADHRAGLENSGLGQDKPFPLDGLGFLQEDGAKVGSTSSNYDDALQFVKKRRYLHTANIANSSGSGRSSGEYNGIEHTSSQPLVVSSVMDGDTSLSLLDPSAVGVDKRDKSGIPDEVMLSLLDHYTLKGANSSHHHVHFDIGDQRVELNPQPPAGAAEASQSSDSPNPSGEKTIMMHEYSRFLLQALERTSLGASLSLGAMPPSYPVNPLYADKSVYTTSPLDFGHSAASPSLPSPVPKSHFVMPTSSSPQDGFRLEPSPHQQLTPSQELTEQLEKQHSSTPTSSYQISPSDLSVQKEQLSVKSVCEVYPLAPSQDLDSSKPSYQIENFAQAFGLHFKPDVCSLTYGSDSGGELDLRIRTPVSEFSGYSSLLSDVSEPVSTGSKTPTSQSYR